MSEKVLNRVAGALASAGNPGSRGCLPARPPRARPPKLPELERPRPKAERNGAEDLLVLEFAHLSLNRGGQADGEPSEMVVSMRPGRVTREGVNAIVGLMNKVLDLPDVYGWFAVTFDFRAHPMPNLQLETALHIMRWDCEPGWQARCMCQCAHCVILVEASTLQEAKQQLASWYSFRPPPYSTYLATEPAGECGADGAAVRFSPPKSWPAPALAPAPSPAPVPPSPGSSAPSTPVPGGGHAACRRQPAAARPAPEGQEKDLEASLESGFVFVSHFPRRDGRRELLVQCRDREQSDEALDRALDFMDRFVHHPVAQGGFSITFDLRGLRMPTLSMVMRIAAWGNQPERTERFHKFNFASKVVFSPGLAFTIGKGLLGLFFTQCPPVVRTYVLTDPNEPEEDAIHFDPAPGASGAPAASSEAAVRWAREARLPGQDEACSFGATVPLLDVGFASLSLSLASGRRPCQLQLRKGAGAPGREGVSALVQLMLHTLGLPQVCGDFALTFDLRGAERLEEGLDLVLRVHRWRADPEWRRLCARRCVGWRVAVEAGKPFKQAHTILDCFFYLHPPACPTRLGTSLEAEAKGAPEEWLPKESGGAGGPCSRLISAAPCSAAREEAFADPPWSGSGLPCSFDAGFLRLNCGPGQLSLSAQKGPQTEEGLGMVLAFMDDFCHSFHAEGGFAAHLDLRGLQLPSLETVCHLACWGAVPRRRERWQRLCVSCAVVAGEGPTFLLAKGLLSKFFSLCPPACRTFLLRSPDDSPDGALAFDPLPEEPEAADASEGSVDGVAESMLRPIYALGFGGQPLPPDDDPWVF